MKCFNKAGEKIVILAVREALPQRFEATSWTDLRVGWFLSICGNADPGEDDIITGLGPENIGADDAVPLAFSDRVAIGIIGGTGRHDYVFLGYTNAGVGRTDPSPGRSRLLSSDANIGTSNSNYWRATNGRNDKFTAQIIDSSITRVASNFGSQPHFAQANIGTGGPAGYATLLMLRFTRSDSTGRSKIITMQVPKAASGDHSDILFSSSPDLPGLQSNLESFPTTVQTLGPVEVSNVPDTLYWFWPFHNSRLRIHAAAILKIA